MKLNLRRANVVVTINGFERYIFLYDDDPESSKALLQKLAQFAANPELSFTWHDASRLSRKARKLKESKGA